MYSDVQDISLFHLSLDFLSIALVLYLISHCLYSFQILLCGGAINKILDNLKSTWL